MSRLDRFKVKALETLVLKFCGEEGEKMVKHHRLVDDVIAKLGVIICDDGSHDKLHNCTDDELNVINSRLTMIINTLNSKEVK